MLELSFHSLDGSKAVGIDGMTKEKYGENLDENLSQLLMRIRTGSYHPQALRIVEIPKSDGSKRPLTIACFEDKVVQESVRRILERIYEPLFLECSHGFRLSEGVIRH
jgi:retron-type reverse transcriptase